jgi:hypothetical protein
MSTDCNHVAVRRVPNDPESQNSEICDDCADVRLVPYAEIGFIMHAPEVNHGIIGWYCSDCHHVNIDHPGSTAWPRDCSTCQAWSTIQTVGNVARPRWRKDKENVLHVLHVQFQPV